MNTHHIKLDDYRAKPRGDNVLYLGTAGSHGNEQLQVTLGDGWAGLTVQAIFHPSEVAVQLPADGLLDVPWEATANPLTMLQGKIVFQGFNQDRLVNTVDLAYIVAQHSSTVGRDEEPYTPGIVEGVLNQMAADKEEIMSAAQEAAKANREAQQALEKVEDTAAKAMEHIIAAASALPAASADAARQAITVRPDGTGYQLAGPFLPDAAGIRPTVLGNPAVCSDSIAWSFQGLKIYGRSTQDGTPSPENPVPILNAGGSGSIVLTISDGAEQSQTVTCFTPNGLAGIQVKSSGNYTDADGQQWLANYRDWERGVDVQTCCNVVLDGTIGAGFDNNGVWHISQTAQKLLFGGILYFDSVNQTPFSERFTVQSTNYNVANDPSSFYVSYDGSICSLATSLFPTPNTNGFKAYFKENPTRFILPYVEPILTPIPSEELAAYRALHTYAGTTTVSTAEGMAGIEARYVADGTNYLKSVMARIEKLEA